MAELAMLADIRRTVYPEEVTRSPVNCASWESSPVVDRRTNQLCYATNQNSLRQRNDTDQGAEDEYNDEDSSEDCLAGDVAVADGRHRDDRKVRIVPVGQFLEVGEIGPRVAANFRL